MSISPYLMAIVLGWIVAQGMKYLIVVVRTNDFGNLRQLYLSGNMPSAHTSTTVALLTVIGLRNGVESGLFGVAALFTAVVAYDAVMVRRSVGEQGEALQTLIRKDDKTAILPRAAKGHQPIEVVVGAVVGGIVGAVVFFATN